MTNSSYRDTVLELLLATLEKPATIEDTTALIDGGIINSLSILGLVTRIEDEFGFEFDDDELTAENFATLGHIVALVEEKA